MSAEERTDGRTVPPTISLLCHISPPHARGARSLSVDEFVSLCCESSGRIPFVHRIRTNATVALFCSLCVFFLSWLCLLVVFVVFVGACLFRVCFVVSSLSPACFFPACFFPSGSVPLLLRCFFFRFPRACRRSVFLVVVVRHAPLWAKLVGHLLIICVCCPVCCCVFRRERTHHFDRTNQVCARVAQLVGACWLTVDLTAYDCIVGRSASLVCSAVRARREPGQLFESAMSDDEVREVGRSGCCFAWESCSECVCHRRGWMGACVGVFGVGALTVGVVERTAAHASFCNGDQLWYRFAEQIGGGGGGGGSAPAQAQVHAQVQAPMRWLDRAAWRLCVVCAWKIL